MNIKSSSSLWDQYDHHCDFPLKMPPDKSWLFLFLNINQFGSSLAVARLSLSVSFFLASATFVFVTICWPMRGWNDTNSCTIQLITSKAMTVLNKVNEYKFYPFISRQKLPWDVKCDFQWRDNNNRPRYKIKERLLHNWISRMEYIHTNLSKFNGEDANLAVHW